MHKFKLIATSMLLGLFIVGCSDNANLTVADRGDQDQDDQQELVGPFTVQGLGDILLAADAFDEPVPINDIMFTEDNGFGEPFSVN